MFDFRIPEPKDWVVWFDLDDTLWDFRRNSALTLSELYESCGLNKYWQDAENWIRDYHSVNDPLWEMLAKGLVSHDQLRFRRFHDTFVNAGMEEDKAAAIALDFDKMYLEQLALKPNVVEGAMPAISRMRMRGFRIGVLSNGFRDTQYSKMKSAGLSDFVDIVVTSDELGINKPDVRLFRFAEKKAEVTADRCIFIGDNASTDIAGALAAGWAVAVWFNPEHKMPSYELNLALTGCSCLQVVDHLSQIQF